MADEVRYEIDDGVAWITINRPEDVQRAREILAKIENGTNIVLESDRYTISFTEQALMENIQAFVGAINRAKPSGAKGTYILKVSLSSTMGPGVKLDIASVVAAAA